MSDQEKIVSISQEEESQGEKIVIKIFKHRNTILSAICIVFAASIMAARFLPNKGKKMEEYAKADIAYQKWKMSHEFNAQLLEDLRQAMKSHPELVSKYNAGIYQKFVALDKGKEVADLAKKEVKRTSFMGHYYTDFSTTTIEIVNQNYEKAIQKALLLKEHMQEDQTFASEGYEGSVLYGFNLLRIANLHRALGNLSKEKQAWKTAKQYLYDAKNNWQPKPKFIAFVNHFMNNKVSLFDYIQARETELSNDNA